MTERKTKVITAINMNRNERIDYIENLENKKEIIFKIKKLYEKMKEVLKDREKLILELRFGLNGEKPKTQNEIADSMAISRSYVSRIETKAIN